MSNLSIITDISINSLYTITGANAAEVNRIPEIFSRYVLKAPDESKRPTPLTDRNIVNLSKRLHQLNASIEEYADLCFIWKIIGIFTGTLWNYLRLKNTLKDVMQVVDSVADPIRRKPHPNNPPVEPTSSPFDALKKLPVEPTPSPFAAFAALKKPPATPIINPPKLPIINLSKLPKTPPLPPETPLPSFQPKPAPVFLTKAERIQRKITLVTAASTLATAQLNDNQSIFKTCDNKTAKKVNDFFKETLNKLESGVDAPLPRWFHATGSKDYTEFASVTSIVKSKVLKQGHSAAGYGTYLSTCNESHMYGPWTFAIDEKELEGTEGYFFPAEGAPAPGFLYAALWVRVLKDIPLTSESVAFMVARANKTEDLRNKVLKPNKLDVDVLTPDEASSIHMYLELADQARAKPSNLWEPNQDDPINRINEHNLPENMRHKGWPRLRASYTRSLRT